MRGCAGWPPNLKPTKGRDETSKQRAHAFVVSNQNFQSRSHVVVAGLLEHQGAGGGRSGVALSFEFHNFKFPEEFQHELSQSDKRNLPVSESVAQRLDFRLGS